MELLQLRYFVKLAKFENITKTANDLFISPASLSTTIKRLENELGTKLFDRVGRNIVLNDTGKLFLLGVEKSLNELDQVVTDVRNQVTVQTKACISIVYFNPRIWYEILENFKRLHPNVSFELNISRNPGNLRNFDKDFYLGNRNDILNHAEKYEYIELLPPEVTVAVVNKGHPLSSRRQITMSELENELIFSTTANYDNERDTFSMRLIREYGIHPQIIKGDAMLRYNLLMKNECVALTTNLGFLVNFFDSKNLVAIPIKTQPEKARIQVLAWKRNSKLNQMHKLFINYMSEACKKAYKI